MDQGGECSIMSKIAGGKLSAIQYLVGTWLVTNVGMSTVLVTFLH